MELLNMKEILFQLADDWTKKELAVYIYSNYDCSMDEAIITTNLIYQINN